MYKNVLPEKQVWLKLKQSVPRGGMLKPYIGGIMRYNRQINKKYVSNWYRVDINDEQLEEYCRYKKLRMYLLKRLNSITKLKYANFWSNLKALKRAKGGLSTINKDDVRHCYFKDLLNRVAKVEPVNSDNCNTRLLSDDRQCLACDNNIPDVLNTLITHDEIDKVISSTHIGNYQDLMDWWWNY